MQILKSERSDHLIRSVFHSGLIGAFMFLRIDISIAQWVQIRPGSIECLAPVPNGNGGTNIFAGTSSGESVLLSTDGGESWTQVGAALANAEVYSLAFNGEYLFAGTLSQGFYLTSDNGKTWIHELHLPLNTYIYALAVSGRQVFAGCSNGYIMKTTDNGGTWTLPDSGLTGRPIYSLTVVGRDLFAGTEVGVLRSTNDGVTWFGASTGLPGRQVKTFAVSGTHLFAGTFDGVYFSTDSGMRWNAAGKIPVFNGMFVLSLAVSDTVIFAGNEWGSIHASTNKGTTWSPLNSGLPLQEFEPRALLFSDKYLLVGAEGLWKRPLSEVIPPPKLEPPTALAVTNISATGFVPQWSCATATSTFSLDVARDSGFVSYVPGYQNLDVGNVTSRAVATGLIPNTSYYYRIRAVWAEGGGSGNSNTIMVTTKDTTTVDIFPLAKNMQRIYAYGRGYSTYAPYTYSTETDIDSGTVAYVVFDSTRSGDTLIVWTVAQTEHLIHHSRIVWYTGTYDTSYSVDTTVIVTLYEDLRGWHEIRCDSRVWSFSHWGIGDPLYRRWFDTARTAYQTDDLNWAVERLYFDRNRGLYRRDYSKNTLGNTHYSLSIRAVLLDPLSDVPVRDFPGNATDFTLFQNYPNPFNPTTVVSYRMSVASSVKLAVYDILGREVAVLVNEKRTPGMYQVTFDGSNLASGVYFYRLSVSPLAGRDLVAQESKGQAGYFVATKRLLLLK